MQQRLPTRLYKAFDKAPRSKCPELQICVKINNWRCRKTDKPLFLFLFNQIQQSFQFFILPFILFLTLYCCLQSFSYANLHRFCQYCRFFIPVLSNNSRKQFTGNKGMCKALPEQNEYAFLLHKKTAKKVAHTI